MSQFNNVLIYEISIYCPALVKHNKTKVYFIVIMLCINPTLLCYAALHYPCILCFYTCFIYARITYFEHVQ